MDVNVTISLSTLISSGILLLTAGFVVGMFQSLRLKDTTEKSE